MCRRSFTGEGGLLRQSRIFPCQRVLLGRERGWMERWLGRSTVRTYIFLWPNALGHRVDKATVCTNGIEKRGWTRKPTHETVLGDVQIARRKLFPLSNIDGRCQLQMKLILYIVSKNILFGVQYCRGCGIELRAEDGQRKVNACLFCEQYFIIDFGIFYDNYDIH